MSGTFGLNSKKISEAEIKNIVRDRRNSEIASVKAEDIKVLLPSDKRRELNDRAAVLERELAARFGK